ncbi:hypothetical protein E2562_036879 [Oryza meyeriana var. granulata]|uniref:Uncharacterized protein n=1 Tax=Oryza meyeriana var. granulata TaxID=110450 RepID=A0A6G1CW90_9ORYZ|nr:hypothetical protein E2562_036879 [Oryza meyeriana var. granulata]
MATPLSSPFAPAATTTTTPLPSPHQLRNGRRCHRPRSSVGVPVEFGFSAYSERLNGALASVGLAALLLVELGSGQALVKYHQPATLLLQVYTIAAAGAVFVKYEKERISVWPGPPATKPWATADLYEYRRLRIGMNINDCGGGHNFEL